MRFFKDYAKEEAKVDLSSRSDEEIMRVTEALLRYYILNFNDEKLSPFLQTVAFLNAAAEEGQYAFEYELDKEKKTGRFRLVAKDLVLDKESYLSKGLLLALEYFPCLQTTSEDGAVVVRGKMSLE